MHPSLLPGWAEITIMMECRQESHCENVRTSKFWQKSKEKKRNFCKKLTKGISGLDLGKKNSKLPHACVPLKKSASQCKAVEVTANSKEENS